MTTITPKTYEIDDYILVNFPKDGSYDKALEWGKENGYFSCSQEEVVALSEKYPKLNKKLNEDYMYLLSTESSIFDGSRRACRVWWDGSERGADLFWVGDFGYAYDWFAFSKSLKLEPKTSSLPLSLDLALNKVKEAGYVVYKPV